MSYDIREAMLLRHPGNNPDGKFYFAALIEDTNVGKFLTLTNWGRGRGLSGTQFCYGDTGQAQVAGPFMSESAARNIYNKKLSEKLDGGYTGSVVDCRYLGITSQNALIAKRGGASTPVSPPPAPQPINTATLLARPLTPETIAEIVKHRIALTEQCQAHRHSIASIEAEIEALTLRLEFRSA